MTFSPFIDPPAKIEVADTEVGAHKNSKRFPQGWQEIEGNVVEDAGHGIQLFEK